MTKLFLDVEQEGRRAANKEVETGVEAVCPYHYTNYRDTKYRAWMDGYWEVINSALGSGSDYEQE